MEENENEYYTQSFHYISEEEAGEQWLEEEEHPGEGEQEQQEKPKESQEEYDEERKKLLAKAWAEIARKEAKRQEQERGLKAPIDKSTTGSFTPRTAPSGNKITRQEKRYGGPTTSSTSTRKERAKKNLPRQEKDEESHTNRFSPETTRTPRTGNEWESSKRKSERKERKQR